MVNYKGTMPTFIPTAKDWKEKKIEIGPFLHWHQNGLYFIRVFFKSPGLKGEIRTTCYGNKFAVDFQSEWGNSVCLTTECETIKQALAILWHEYKSWQFYLEPKILERRWRFGFK